MKKALIFNIGQSTNNDNLSVSFSANFQHFSSGHWNENGAGLAALFPPTATHREIEKALIDATIAYVENNRAQTFFSSPDWDDFSSKDIISFISVSIG